ncbi:MAG: hypothetical protein QXD41_03725 [Nitrososphaeria archaeon]
MTSERQLRPVLAVYPDLTGLYRGGLTPFVFGRASAENILSLPEDIPNIGSTNLGGATEYMLFIY